MKPEVLKKVLENHRHWIARDIPGWENMRANLSGADLSGASLSGANLSGANLYRASLSGANLYRASLSGADLSGASLSGANLSGANLYRADLSGADLSGASLSGANLSGANLSGANLSGASLYRASLSGANLSGASLSGAYLSGADLSGASLSGANLSGASLSGANLYRATNAPYIPMTCPDSGSFIGWKKASNLIVKLQILDDSRRSSACGRKCRCDKALVLTIQNIDGSDSDITFVASDYDQEFIYKVGEIVTEPQFDTDRFAECAPGIHFFINRNEAVQY